MLLILKTPRNQLQRLTAPVDGVVQQLASTPSAAASHPHNSSWSSSRKKKIEVEAFLFTKYGTIDAELISISMRRYLG